VPSEALFTGRMIIELVNYVVNWLNAFPPSIGVSKIFRPRMIMTGTTLDFEKKFKLHFGAYTELHEDMLNKN
jgi:hypothetical protein